jgi:hypothetical protein
MLLANRHYRSLPGKPLEREQLGGVAVATVVFSGPLWGCFSATSAI